MNNLWKNWTENTHWEMCHEDMDLILQVLQKNIHLLQEHDKDTYYSEQLTEMIQRGYFDTTDIEIIISFIDSLEMKMGKKFPLNIKSELLEVDEEGIEFVSVVVTKRKQPSLKQIYKKVKNPEPVILKKVNLTENGRITHPLREELMLEAKDNVFTYNRLLKEKIIELEKEFPEYEDFYYEFETDAKSSWYNLMGKGI